MTFLFRDPGIYLKKIFWLFIVMAVPVLVSAQDSDDKFKIPLNDSIKAHKLKEVEVKSHRISSTNKSPVPVQVLSGGELKRTSSLSVADAMRYLSGVQLKDYGGIGGLKTINVRSMGTNHTSVFYDGLQLGNAQNGQIDLGKFSLDNIEEITLYNGQRTDLLQPATGVASSASVYLKTLSPRFKTGTKLNAGLNLKAGSFGLINPSALLQYKISDQIYGSLNTSLTNANGKYKFRYTNGTYDTSAIRSNGDVLSNRIEAALYGKLSDEGTWNIKFYNYQSERGLPGATVGNRFDYKYRIWDKNFFIQSSVRHNVNKKYSILINSKYANDRLRYLDPEITNLNGLLENEYHEQELYFSMANSYYLTSFWQIAISTDYRYNTMDANLYRFPHPKRHTVLAALATQLKIKKLDLQLNVLSTSLSDQVQEGAAPGSKQEFNPTFMASWQPFSSDQLRLRGFYKSMFRTPTFNDLYFTQIGNRFLKPEYTRQYDLGITFSKTYDDILLSAISLQADAYYNEVKNKIIAQPGNNIAIWSMRNLGLVHIKGLDLNIKSSWELSKEVSISASMVYTYQKATDANPAPNENYGDQIPYIPVHSGSLLAGADYRRIGLNYSFIYTGERYNQAANNIYNYMQPWYTHDLSAFYKTTLNGNELKLNAEINNLLNQHYDVIANFPMPGRNYRLTLSYKL
ncbi:TonB-dependent receptor [Desertivirga xinjiangensis]|uniref:TonB-dependent receptor n=1 Tax=Desertivirga xinjiangensis TaxID=539206 RepID=UPI002108A2A9|nr:TonB-dependent receptor [Pedobacter xinjiangensis]